MDQSQSNFQNQQPTQQSMLLALQAQMQMGSAGGGQNNTNASGDGINQQGGAPMGLPAHMLVGAPPFQNIQQPGVDTNLAHQQPQQAINHGNGNTDANTASGNAGLLLGNGINNGDAMAQQGGQAGAGGMIGGLSQNALLSAAAMGGNNMGFNLQQLQLAQQLMAAGLPPNLALNGIGPQQNSVNGAGANIGANANVMNQLGGMGAAGAAGLNSIGGIGNTAVAASTPGLGGVLGGNAVSAQPTNPLGVGALGAGTKTEAATKTSQLDGTIPSQPISKAGQPDWAEPFAGKGKKEPPFPLKLHQILSNPEFQECIIWNPHGRSWRILKPPVFEQLVIPLYFRHAKYASFMRQVNGWGFKRIVSGNDHNSYFHELFLRDYPQLCLKMKRIRKGEKPEETQGVEVEQETGGEMVEEVIDGKEGGSNEAIDGDKSDGSVLGKKTKLLKDNPLGDSKVEGDQSATSAQTLASLGIIPGTTGLATAAPGYNALAGLQTQMQNGTGTTSILHQQQDTKSLSNLNPMSTLQNGAVNNPGQGVGAVSQGALDSSALLKLQQALQLGGASSILQQQPQQPPAPSAQGFNLSNLNFLQGSMGGTLAAQLQAATQAPQRTGEQNDKNN